MNLELELSSAAPAGAHEQPISATPQGSAKANGRPLYDDGSAGYTPLTPEEFPNIDHVITEDGQPVEGIFYSANMVLLTEPLYTSWKGPSNGKSFVAYRNVGVFASPNLPPLVPDVLLSFVAQRPEMLRQKIHNTYFAWVFGKMPDAAIEIVSNNEGGEYTRKFVGYAEFGVPYYIVFDPSNRLKRGILQAFHLTGGSYQPIDPAWIEELELGLVLWHGSYEGCVDTWLRWCDREGNLIPSSIERSEQERRHSEQERQCAELERQRAELERRSAEIQRQIAQEYRQIAEQNRQTAEQERQTRVDAQRKALEAKLQATLAVEELQRLRERMKALGLELPS